MIPVLVNLGDYPLGEINQIKFDTLKSDLGEIIQKNFDMPESDIEIINIFNFYEPKFDAKCFARISFNRFQSNIETLARQPFLEVDPNYVGKEIDYEGGYRGIYAIVEHRAPPSISYLLTDSGIVEGSEWGDGECVARRAYTREEVEGL